MARATHRFLPVGMYGALLIALALLAYVVGVILAAILRLVGADQDPSRWLVWSSGIPLLAGVALVVIDVAVLAPRRRAGRTIFDVPVDVSQVTIVLTAYNDEASIGEAVADFRAHPRAARVIVVDNNSSDDTASVAAQAGAIVHVEEQPGYGRCVYRCLQEGAAWDDTEVVVLCEGDMTFRAADLDKFAAYMRHAHVVNGTRIVEQLREPATQLTSFMYYGNFIAGKLLEIKHLGKGTTSDVGTTYKACRTSFLRDQLGMFDPSVNLEFNAHFMDRLLASEFRLVEVPVTFHPRVGVSKGGNTSNWRALKVGARMLLGIVLGWRLLGKA